MKGSIDEEEVSPIAPGVCVLVLVILIAGVYKMTSKGQAAMTPAQGAKIAATRAALGSGGPMGRNAASGGPMGGMYGRPTGQGMTSGGMMGRGTTSGGYGGR